MKTTFARKTAILLASCLLGSTLSAAAASLTVRFKTPEGVEAEFSEVNILLVPPGAASVEEALRHASDKSTFEKEFTELEPGAYIALVFTGAWEKVDDGSRPGAFRIQQRVNLATAESEEELEVVYEPLDTSEYRGSASASGQAVGPLGKPMADLELSIVAMIDSAGRWELTKVTTDSEGKFQVDGLAEDVDYYVVTGDDPPTGRISAGDEITITVPPRVGSEAPDVEFFALTDDKKLQLSDFRGKVVVVDFWATWCGPCQAPMAKMQTYRDKHPGWGERVSLIALSIDDEKEAAVRHMKDRGWDNTFNAWAGEGGFRATAPSAFAVSGIPQVYVIDPSGTIAAAGHPMALDIPEIVDELLKKKGATEASGG